MKAAMLLFLICIPFASAQTVYKTVDEQGRVSYTSTPPSGDSPVEELVPPPEPSPEAVEAARQREKDLQEAAQERRMLRLQREQAAAERKPETRVIQQQVVPYAVVPSYSRFRPYYGTKPRPERPSERPARLPYPESRPVPRSPANR